MPSKHGDYNTLTWLEHASRLTSHMPLVTASTASNFLINRNNRNLLCKLLQATSRRFPCATPAWLDSKVTRAKSSNSVDGLVRPPGGPAGSFTSQYPPPLIKDDSEFICVYLSYLQFIYIYSSSQDDLKGDMELNSGWIPDQEVLLLGLSNMDWNSSWLKSTPGIRSKANITISSRLKVQQHKQNHC